MSSLYLHIPFCTRKCPYCDFFSQAGSQQQIDEYIELLKFNLHIIKQKKPQYPSLKTIFFGGGTPSLLSAKQIDHLLGKIEQVFSIETGAEISLEANPGTVDLEKLRGYRQAGVNRLSLGVQSLNDQNLHTLGRIHNVEQINTGIDAARTAGFENISLDLMFGLPGQGVDDLEQELTNLLKFSPEHVSLYGLSFEQGTAFYRQLQTGKLCACDENLYAEQYRFLHDMLVSGGFDHYEISNFALPGKSCRHNQNYWQRNGYFAVGAGAHSFSESGWGERWHVPADLQRYRELLGDRKDPAELLETFTREGAMKEYVYLVLRTRKGLGEQEFAQQFNVSLKDIFSKALQKTGQYLLIDPETGRYYFNLDGWLIFDHLIGHFL